MESDNVLNKQYHQLISCLPIRYICSVLQDTSVNTELLLGGTFMILKNTPYHPLTMQSYQQPAIKFSPKKYPYCLHYITRAFHRRHI